jgi:hypothetical protein
MQIEKGMVSISCSELHCTLTPKIAVLAPVIPAGDERGSVFGVWEGLLL